MCCFSRPVVSVTDTNIFARASKDGRQFLVYSMKLDAKEELAMILPLPVPKASKEDAVRFINLEKYPDFFAELRSGFPEPKPGRSLSNSKDAPATLKVVEVGSFIASFVPSVADFKRVDEKFRLPADVWDKLPMYRGFGFAVFQLKKGEHKIHPMAFEFPRQPQAAVLSDGPHSRRHRQGEGEFPSHAFLPEVRRGGRHAVAGIDATRGHVHEETRRRPGHHRPRGTLLQEGSRGQPQERGHSGLSVGAVFHHRGTETQRRQKSKRRMENGAREQYTLCRLLVPVPLHFRSAFCLLCVSVPLW